ncbi:hypothetical protein Q6332_29220, partial [Klebsiella pneumoniae]
DRAEACVAVHSEHRNISFAAALRDGAEGKVALLNTRSQKAIASFLEMMDGLRALLPTAAADEDEPFELGDIGEVAEAVLERTGYRAEL